MEFIEMSKEQKNEVAIIPAGHYVSIVGCRFTLLEDTKVEADQANLDYILKHQQDFYKGVGVVSENPSLDGQSKQHCKKAERQIDELTKSSTKSPSNDERLVFLAKTPDGQEFKIFSNGSCEGFPDEIRVHNYWLPLLQYEIASRVKQIKERFDTNNN